MTTIIIGGVCRAGKSQLAKLLFQHNQCTVIHLDPFLNAVRNNYHRDRQIPKAKTKLQNYYDTRLVKAIRNMGNILTICTFTKPPQIPLN